MSRGIHIIKNEADFEKLVTRYARLRKEFVPFDRIFYSDRILLKMSLEKWFSDVARLQDVIDEVAESGVPLLSENQFFELALRRGVYTTPLKTALDKKAKTLLTPPESLFAPAPTIQYPFVSPAPTTTLPSRVRQEEEESVLREVLEESKRESSQRLAEREREERELQLALAASLKEQIPSFQKEEEEFRRVLDVSLVEQSREEMELQRALELSRRRSRKRPAEKRREEIFLKVIKEEPPSPSPISSLVQPISDVLSSPAELFSLPPLLPEQETEAEREEREFQEALKISRELSPSSSEITSISPLPLSSLAIESSTSPLPISSSTSPLALFESDKFDRQSVENFAEYYRLTGSLDELRALTSIRPITATAFKQRNVLTPAELGSLSQQ